MNASSLLLLDRLSRVGVNASCTLRRTLTTTTTTAALQHSRRNASTASGPEVAYQDAAHFAGYQTFDLPQPLPLDNHPTNPLKGARVAFETWGQLNDRKDNAVLLHTGLSASSHARSTECIPAPGWWENFIGPGHALDTDKFFIICSNVLGSCFGSTGPSSVNPDTGRPYGGDFPVITIFDIVRMQVELIRKRFGIEQLHCSVGSSMGGMQTLALCSRYPGIAKRAVIISSSAYSSPHSIALRHVQRQALVSDPHWQGGHYYDTPYFPEKGLRLAREIATTTTLEPMRFPISRVRYRSGPEWDSRFARRRSSVFEKDKDRQVDLNDALFAIEEYLGHQGKKWVGTYDPNSLLYLSKAMDMFSVAPDGGTIADGLKPMKAVPTMIIGVKSDILFPVWQQRELADALREVGNKDVVYYELDAIFGHDTFLVDTTNVVPAVKGHLEFH